MSIILKPFALLLLFLYNITGSYGVALLLFCLVIRLILFPFFLKGRKGMLSMSGLTEKQKALQQKYARDRQKYSVELQKLYQEEGVKPSGGCLWSFLPIPFLMAIYAIIRKPLTYLMSMTSDNVESVYYLLYNEAMSGSASRNGQLQMAQDVFHNYDKIVSAIPELAGMPKIDFSFLGLNLTDVPHFLFWRTDNMGYNLGLWLIPMISAVLSVVSMIVTNKINARVLNKEQVVDQSARTTMIIMPLFSLWICFTLPAALGVYWIGNSIVAILQEIANVPFLKKYMKKMEEDKVKRKAEEKERVVREKKAQAEAKKKAAEEMRRIQMERKLNKSISTASREGMRTYARGRLYDPDRYPTFPYKDPNDLYHEEVARLEAEKEAKGKGKKNKDAAAPAPTEDKPEMEAPAETVEAPTAEPVPETPVEAVEEEAFIEESFLEEPDQGPAEE